MQQVGNLSKEEPPSLVVHRCSKSGGCQMEEATVTLDANWRWVHSTSSTSADCLAGDGWAPAICPDPETCARRCAIEGVTQDAYDRTYGIRDTGGGIEIGYVTKSTYGENVGSRLYLTEGDNYRMFRLLNREMTFDVDVSRLPCGLNGAVYLVGMQEDGGLSELNAAGAKYGTGYCAAQCPGNMKFLQDGANMHGWSSSGGRSGLCCSEVDIWEANMWSASLASHPCDGDGPVFCERGGGGADDTCGSAGSGPCAQGGCDFNAFRLGNKSFYGPGLAVDTGRPITVVTQFITSDGTDEGELAEIRRFYVQDGNVIPNSEAALPAASGVTGNSITDAFCDASQAAWGEPLDHKAHGGLKQIGEALRRGMVLVLSLWDDGISNMNWLDSVDPRHGDASKPGVARGLCTPESGRPSQLRTRHQDAGVTYTNFKHGEIGSTFVAPTEVMPVAAPEAPASGESRGSGHEERGGGFCCLAARDRNDYCNTCWPGARAHGDGGDTCGRSAAACMECGDNAKWCTAPPKTPAAGAAPATSAAPAASTSEITTTVAPTTAKTTATTLATATATATTTSPPTSTSTSTAKTTSSATTTATTRPPTTTPPTTTPPTTTPPTTKIATTTTTAPATSTSTTSEDSAPFDCKAKENLTEAWATAKQAWCCTHQRLHCEKGHDPADLLEGSLEEVPPTVVPGSELMLKLRDQNLRVKVIGVEGDGKEAAAAQGEGKGVRADELQAAQKYGVPGRVGHALTGAGDASGSWAITACGLLGTLMALSFFGGLAYRHRWRLSSAGTGGPPHGDEQGLGCRRLVLLGAQTPRTQAFVQPADELSYSPRGGEIPSERSGLLFHQPV